MKKIVMLLNLLLLCFNVFSEDDLPSIKLPKIELDIEDKKKIDVELQFEDTNLTFFKFSDIEKPNFSNMIKIDLEVTLPEKIDSPDKQKPIDAIALFGYGLNNNLLIDFSLFIKEINPQVSIKYLRESRETAWIENFNKKNQISLDDFKSEIIYSYKKFFLGSELGYYSKTYSLQGQSIFSNFTKRVLNFDIGPSLKFDYQNDLTLRVLNSFIFNNSYADNIEIKRSEFAYLLDSELVYSQVFAQNHYITAKIGYDFNYSESKKLGNKDDFFEADNIYSFNNIKANINYSTMLKDSFLIKASIDFLGMFRNTEFFWFILPYTKFGYNYFDYFSCYIEGGSLLIEKPDQYWIKTNNYSVYPVESTPGYRWFGKTGLRASVTGWFNAGIDFEGAYNMYGNDWTLTGNAEKLWTIMKREFWEINLYISASFNYKKYFEIKIEWKHFFYDKPYFEAQDTIYTILKWSIPNAGLEFFIDFNAKLLRYDNNNIQIGNIYLMNTGIDWNFKEKFGLGIKFNNILYFQRHQIIKYYDEPGFEFLAYIKIGF